eukprot:SAG11_NODE_1717_length_4382_cov_13.711651_5_plen_175_part_00
MDRDTGTNHMSDLTRLMLAADKVVRRQHEGCLWNEPMCVAWSPPHDLIWFSFNTWQSCDGAACMPRKPLIWLNVECRVRRLTRDDPPVLPSRDHNGALTPWRRKEWVRITSKSATDESPPLVDRWFTPRACSALIKSTSLSGAQRYGPPRAPPALESDPGFGRRSFRVGVQRCC